MKNTIKFLGILLFALFLFQDAEAQVPPNGIINHYAPVINIDNSCPTVITTQASLEFSVGDKIMIIQMTGAIVDTASMDPTIYGSVQDFNNTGNYEFAFIDILNLNATSNIITLTTPLLRQYDPINGSVQIVRVHEAGDFTIDNTLTCLPWDGQIGGVLALEVSNILTFSDNINVSGLGFAGNNNTSVTAFFDNACANSSLNNIVLSNGGNNAQKGNGIALNSYYNANSNNNLGRGALANAGGGGNNHNAGGGGGGNTGNGGQGGNTHTSQNNVNGCPLNAMGGYSLPYNPIVNRLFLGGSGGNGHANVVAANTNFTAGGNGGGIVHIVANTITGDNFNIASNGTNAPSDNTSGTFEGAGGGGAGGTVIINFQTASNQLNILTNGGNGGNTNDSTSSPGGGGGGGIVWLNQNIPLLWNTSFLGGIHGFEGGGTAFFSTNGMDGQVSTNYILPPFGVNFDAHIDLINFSNETCFEDCDGSINFGISSLIGNPPFNWELIDLNSLVVIDDGVQAQPASFLIPITGLCGGDYQLSIWDQAGCSESLSHTVIEALEFEIDILTDDPNCFNLCNGEIMITPNGGTTPYAILLDGVNQGQTTSWSSLCAGTYELEIQDANGCSISETISLVQPVELSLEVQITNPTCTFSCNGEININPTGGTAFYTIFLNGLNQGQTTSWTNLCPGTYQILMEDITGCSVSESVLIEEISNFDVTLHIQDFENESCPEECDGSLSFGVSNLVGNPPFNWQIINTGTMTPVEAGTLTNPVSFIASTTDLCEGNYEFSIWDQAGCEQNLTQTIEPGEELDFDVVINHPCFNECNGRIEIIYGVPTATYIVVWDDGSTGQIKEDLCPGVHNYTVINELGCEKEGSVTLIPSVELSITYETIDPSCPLMEDGEITIFPAGGTSFYTIYFNGVDVGQTTTFTGLSAGTYTIIMEDISGCSITEGITISDPKPDCHGFYFTSEIIGGKDKYCYGTLQPISVEFNGIIGSLVVFEVYRDGILVGGITSPFVLDQSPMVSPIFSSLEELLFGAGVDDPECGDYSIEFTVFGTEEFTCCTTEAVIIVELDCNCCPAATDDAYQNLVSEFGTEINDIDDNGDGVIVLEGKYYIEEDITIEDITLDITNCDLVFNECAGFIVNGTAQIEANNSVFRPCDPNSTWRGILLDTKDESVHNFSENTFKNAAYAINALNNSNAQINNNLFSNCFISVVVVSNESFEYPIFSNSFVVDQERPEFKSLECYGLMNIRPDAVCVGIAALDSKFTGELTQNRFTNNQLKEEFLGMVFNTCNGAKVSENTFSDVTHAILLESCKGGKFALENNEMEVSRIFEGGLAQILVSNTSSETSITGNEITATFSDTRWNGGFNGIEVSSSKNAHIISNSISGGFAVSIYMMNSKSLNCTSNEVSDYSSFGILNENCSNSRISCNDLNGNSVKSGYGILVRGTSSKTQVYSNCVKNNYIAISLNAFSTPRDGSLIDVRDNFLFNYTKAGIFVKNYSNIDIGSATSPGQNTFWSNSDDAFDIEAYTHVVQTFDNFGLSTSTSFILVSSDDQYYSTAACAMQTSIPNDQQDNLGSTFKCYYPETNWHEDFEKSAFINKMIEIPLNEAFDLSEAMLYRLYDYDPQVTLDLYADLMSNFYWELDESYRLSLSIAILENDYSAMVLLLDKLLLIADDAYFYALRLIALDKLSMINLAQLDANTLTELSAYAYIEHTSANLAREILNINYEENLPFVNKIIPEENNSEGSMNILTDEVELSLYPNPGNGLIEIFLNLPNIEQARLEIFDVTGKIILSQELNFVSGASTFDASSLANAIYFITIKGDGKFQKVSKFIKH